MLIRWSWWLRGRRLVSTAAGAEIVPLENTLVGEQLERAIDGRERDPGVDPVARAGRARRRRDGRARRPAHGR